MVDLAKLAESLSESITKFLAEMHSRHESSESERDSRLAGRLDSLRRLDLKHDELLWRTVLAEDRASFLEEIFEQQESIVQMLVKIWKFRLEITEARSKSEGMLEGHDTQKTIQAKKGARGKIAKDPKQTEKAFVYGCWQNWRNNPGSYKGKAAFARDMLDKCQHLESQKKIEDWCREWERNAIT
ncbi:hypothetical protein SAMN05216339_103183 [Nitrosomonas eutropha]|uniref:Uncharacterized protein n=1 Tax=Nitrosomonas eutropha TaxID=916 RepID=A0A1I7GUJ8_9PROT|nr:hypothetical protein [Nitrosomonas eutropha]SFU52091.1 hypothetical protein SAMN05216339_103183 [Nitrosomonas eutropha]